MGLGRFLTAVLACVFCASTAHAAQLQTVVISPEDDDVAATLADQVEFGLEDIPQVLVVDRAPLQRLLDKRDPFEEERLKAAMVGANVDVVIRILRAGDNRPSACAVSVYDRDGLEVERFETGGMRDANDAKKEARKASTRVADVIKRWERKRAEARALRAPPEPKEEAPPPPRKKQRREAPVEEEEPLPAPPDEAPKKGTRADVEAALEDREAPPPRRKAAPRLMDEERPSKPARRRHRVDEPDESVTPSSRRGRVGEVEQQEAQQGGIIDRFVKNLWTLDQPSPYVVVSAGPQLMLWSYTLNDAAGLRRQSVCSPQPDSPASFLCRPHGGADGWLEVWPIRYFGLDTSFRTAATVYPPARSRSGRALTSPENVPSVMAEGHIALKARFVFTFGPVPGAAIGGRIRAAYSRGLAERTTPFVAVPGFHAAQLGAGPEFYLPLLWKHLSFDARAEFTPLVRYQEMSGFPSSVGEALLPDETLNNPGSSSFAMGWRLDGGVRFVVALGFFVELRLFTEGFGAAFAGKGRRTDSRGRFISDGRLVNMSAGTTLAVGWLFPQFLDIPPFLQPRKDR